MVDIDMRFTYKIALNLMTIAPFTTKRVVKVIAVN